MRKRVSILGSGISGVGAAILAKDKGYEVFVSDSNEITSNVKNKLDLFLFLGRKTNILMLN